MDAVDLEVVARTKTRAMQLAEIRLGRDLRGYLIEEYIEKGRRLRDIADDLECDTGTVSRWMVHFGISTRVRTVA
jgi:hypothetical protein